MGRYRNLGRDSGVAGYELSDGTITVQFDDGSLYLYTNQSAGAANIRERQRLALAGQGLNSFIDRRVRKAYAQRLR